MLTFTPWLGVSYKIDTIPPTFSVDPVTSPTYTASQTLTGTMELDAVITVTEDTSAVVGPVYLPDADDLDLHGNGIGPGHQYPHGHGTGCCRKYVVGFNSNMAGCDSYIIG